MVDEVSSVLFFVATGKMFGADLAASELVEREGAKEAAQILVGERSEFSNGFWQFRLVSTRLTRHTLINPALERRILVQIILTTGLIFLRSLYHRSIGCSV